MVTENTTPNRGYQEPAVGNTLEVDVGRLIAALRAIDVDVADALAQIVAKAGLASPAFTGTPTAPTAAPGTDSGQLATTAFVKAALAALVGLAPEALDTIEELAAASEANSDLIDLLESAVALKADAAATTAALAERLKFLGAGVALPTEDIGPIWHADYASVMTWQTFDANSADYEGYASVDIGMPVLDGRSTPRTGYLKRNGASLSKTTHAALWAWAQHNGRVVAIGSWAAGAFVFADNGDGTFKVPDNRGEFERAWDDSRGVDSGRTFGSSQLDQMQLITGKLGGAGSGGIWMDTGTSSPPGSGALSAANEGNNNRSNSGSGATSSITLNSANSPGARTGPETRGRNVALLACIKF